ncbi:MAG TPA: hypothetical protein VLK35_06890 [Methylomirabilota bacterium]|nr:hypothetical protein [Methylomirabilota bacterium]
MTSEIPPGPGPIPACRYPLLGGPAAWYLPLVAAVLAAGAVAYQAFDLAIGAAGLGWVAHRLIRSAVVEVSGPGLTRGLLGLGAFRTRTTVMAWSAVTEVHTAWGRPGDDFALETVVRDREGRTIGLSTAMGLAAYWACLADIVRHAPAAARTGLTNRVLADEPPTRRHLVSALGTAAGLALVLAALVAVHALWAQGRSSLARDLERIGAAEPAAAACAGGSSGGAEWAEDRRDAAAARCR